MNDFTTPTVVIVLIMLALAGCQDKSQSSDLVWKSTLAAANRESQGFVNLWGGSLPNTNISIELARQYQDPLDKDSIEMTVYRGETVYSPVELCHRCFHFMGAYLKTNEKHFLERAEKYAAKLVDLSFVTDDSARFVEFQYDYLLHNRADMKLTEPFSSGMAQGEMLSVMIRLYEFTDNPHYLNTAHEVFRSLTRLRKTHPEHWVARLDSLGYYWLEEFPHNTEPGMTLNGYIAGLYGVYDYYRVTRDSTALFVWEASLTTLKHYLPEFRRPGMNSYYCLGHKHVANDSYHALHASMMYHLHRLTADDYFDEMKNLLESDAGNK